MKIIRPTTIDDTTFTSTNVHEVAPAVWSGATTYGLGDFAHIVDGQVLKIYESLQAGNLNQAPATETAWWVYRSSTYAVYNPATAYSIDDIVIVAADHKVYRSLQAANTGNTPSDNLTGATPWWQDYGATEPWKSYDAKVGSQTTRTGEIEFVLTPGIVGGIALFNLLGTSVDIVMDDPTDGEVYNETIELISTENIFDAFTYFFSPFIYKRNIVRDDLAPYGSATMTVTVNAESNTATAAVGEIVTGQVAPFGESQYGAGVEIIDYSTKEADTFGNYTIIERAFSKRVSVDASIENGVLSYVLRNLEEIRATPVVWVATTVENLESPLLAYGFYRNFNIVVPYPQHSLVNFEIEGLT